MFKDLVLTPYREENFGPHTGPVLFEFQRHGMLAKDFVGKLDAFFSQCRKTSAMPSRFATRECWAALSGHAGQPRRGGSPGRTSSVREGQTRNEAHHRWDERRGRVFSSNRDGNRNRVGRKG